MLVDLDKKMVWLRPPKTGSSSLLHVFQTAQPQPRFIKIDPATDGTIKSPSTKAKLEDVGGNWLARWNEQHHIAADICAEWLEARGHDPKTFVLVGVIRNPWRRAVSAHAHMVNQGAREALDFTVENVKVCRGHSEFMWGTDGVGARWKDVNAIRYEDGATAIDAAIEKWFPRMTFTSMRNASLEPTGRSYDVSKKWTSLFDGKQDVIDEVARVSQQTIAAGGYSAPQLS